MINKNAGQIFAYCLVKKDSEILYCIWKKETDASAFTYTEKNGELTEDELKKMLEDIQKLTDRYIGILEKMLAEKDKDLMTV